MVLDSYHSGEIADLEGVQRIAARLINTSMAGIAAPHK